MPSSCSLRALALVFVLSLGPAAAHANAPFSDIPQDFALRMVAAGISTPLFVVGDIAYAVRGKWPPLLWSSAELVFGAGPWLVISANAERPRLDPWCELLAAGFASHALLSFVFRAQADRAANPGKPRSPPRPVPPRWRMTPVLLPSSHSVLLGVAQRF